MSKTLDLLKKVEFEKRNNRLSAEKIILSSKNSSLGRGLSFKIGLVSAVIFLIVLVFSFGIFLVFKNYNVQKNFMFSKLNKIEESLRNNTSLVTAALADIKKLSVASESSKTKILQLEKDIKEKNSEISSNFKKIDSTLEKADSRSENNYKQIRQLSDEISEQSRLIKNLEKEKTVLNQNITKLESRFNDLAKQDNKADSKQ